MTTGLHIISRFLCRMNERYTCMWYPHPFLFLSPNVEGFLDLLPKINLRNTRQSNGSHSPPIRVYGYTWTRALHWVPMCAHLVYIGHPMYGTDMDVLIMPYSFDGWMARDLWSSIMKVKMQQTMLYGTKTSCVWEWHHIPQISLENLFVMIQLSTSMGTWFSWSPLHSQRVSL